MSSALHIVSKSFLHILYSALQTLSVLFEVLLGDGVPFEQRIAQKVAQQLENSRGIATERRALIADLRAKGEERRAGQRGGGKASDTSDQFLVSSE